MKPILTTLLSLLICVGCKPEEKKRVPVAAGHVRFDNIIAWGVKEPVRRGQTIGIFVSQVLIDSLAKEGVSFTIFGFKDGFGWRYPDGREYTYPYADMPDWINRRVIQIHLQKKINLLHL